MRVAVLAGGRSSEHSVSLDSGATVSAALQEAGHEVVAVRLARDGVWKGPDGAVLALSPGGGLLGVDVAFPVLHGPFGEDGTVQGLLELLDVPYVGAGVLASSLCMDKIVFKDVLAAAGVPQVGYLAVRETAWQDDAGRGAGVPGGAGAAAVRQAGAAGLVGGDRRRCRARTELDGALETAFQHDGLAIVEAFSPGIEVECAVTGNGAPEASLPAEVVLQGADWYDYEAKYTPGGMELEIPARVDAAADRGGPRAGASRRSCASAAPVSRGSTSSSRTAVGCSSTSSTRCRG